jgi:lysophospholipase L1-like esterase
MDEGVVKYIALGDSYTIGTGANENEAWPVLLTKHLKEAGIKTELVANPSKNGFSTQNLIDMELPVFDKSGATFVTLLIGVNDWVREVNATSYKKNLIFILDHIQKKLPNKNNILLITIPDFGVTPQGAYFSNDRDVSKGITEFNNIIKAEAKKRGLSVVDIFEISKQMKDNTELTAKDGLHPSAKEYAVWETLIFPEAKKLLSK